MTSMKYGVHAQPRRRPGPGRLGASGVVEEDRIGKLVGQEVGAPTGTVDLLETGRHGEQGFEVGHRPFMGGEQAATEQRAGEITIEGAVHPAILHPGQGPGNGEGDTQVG